MLTKEQIKSGLEHGTIRLIADPDLESGTVIAVGDVNECWVRFGDSVGAKLTPAEYLHAIPMEKIIDEIYVTLRDCNCDEIFQEEYDSYEAMLEEKIKKGFDQEQFMLYLSRKIGQDTNDALREIIESIIAYGHKHKRVSKDQFCFWLIDMIPFLSFGEAAMFIADESLTKNGQEEKAAAWEEFLSNAKI